MQNAEQEFARLTRVHQEEVGKLRAALQAQACLRLKRPTWACADVLAYTHAAVGSQEL